MLGTLTNTIIQDYADVITGVITGDKPNSFSVLEKLIKSLILLRKMVPPHGLEPRTP